MILIILDCIKFKLFVMLRCHMRSSFSISVLYHAYVYLEFLILACTIYILAPQFMIHGKSRGVADCFKNEAISWLPKISYCQGSERQYCDGTPGRKAYKGDFPFLFEYKVEQDVDFVFIKGAN